MAVSDAIPIYSKRIQHHLTGWPNAYNKANSTMSNGVEWNCWTVSLASVKRTEHRPSMMYESLLYDFERSGPTNLTLLFSHKNKKKVESTSFNRRNAFNVIQQCGQTRWTSFNRMAKRVQHHSTRSPNTFNIIQQGGQTRSTSFNRVAKNVQHHSTGWPNVFNIIQQDDQTRSISFNAKRI